MITEASLKTYPNVRQKKSQAHGGSALRLERQGGFSKAAAREVSAAGSEGQPYPLCDRLVNLVKTPNT
jgi:hypothetical protein